ncbi:MAG TPA: bifunctional diguanylate cyclase/phosphodiesterase, partial [Dissulfurispiraceae bacterium]
VLLPQIAHTEDVAKIAGKLLSIFKAPFAVDGHELHVTPSIGISFFPNDGEFAEVLLKSADIAMYHAKEQGRDNFKFYSPALNIRTLEQMILENSLRQTLQRGELVVYYQPQVNLLTGRLLCAEALVRWQHPELGLLDPMHFIPLAEEIGFIIPIGEWVLRTACIQNLEWQRAGLPPLCITVNLSMRQLQQPDFIRMVAGVLHETGLAPDLLEFEITENTAMQNIELIISNLMKLSSMGIRLSIDDFGTGYSSLSYLKKLPVQKLKIDKAFIRGAEKDPGYKAIIGAIIAMAHSLKLYVVAEGVETEEQLELLRSAGCDGIQGFIFSEPLPPDLLGGMALSSGEPC